MPRRAGGPLGSSNAAAAAPLQSNSGDPRPPSLLAVLGPATPAAAVDVLRASAGQFQVQVCLVTERAIS